MRRLLIIIIICLSSLLFSGNVFASVVNPPTPGSWIHVDQDNYNSQPCGSGSYVGGYADYCGTYFSNGRDHDDGCGCWQKSDGKVGIYCCDSYGGSGIRTCEVKAPTYDATSFTYGGGGYTINCLGSCAQSTWYQDVDGDNYSDGVTQSSCTRPTNYKLSTELTAISGDCNDTNPNVNPSVVETCNGIDDDCDGVRDNGFECVQGSVGCDSSCNLISPCSSPKSSECTTVDILNHNCYSCEDGGYFDVNNMRYCFNYTPQGLISGETLALQDTYCKNISFPGYSPLGLVNFKTTINPIVGTAKNTDLERLEHILSVKSMYIPSRQDPAQPLLLPRGLYIADTCSKTVKDYPVSTYGYLYSDAGRIGEINCSVQNLAFNVGSAGVDENGRLNDVGTTGAFYNQPPKYGAVCQFQKDTEINCNYCTGENDPNSYLCNGDDTNLLQNTVRTLVNTCTLATKCEYLCRPGYTNNGSSCVPNSTQCYTPTDPVYSLEDTLGLDVDGLVGYWPLNGSGADLSAYGNNGTPHGVSVNSGIFNSSYYFDGLSEYRGGDADYIEIPHSDSLNMTDVMTVSAWIKKEGTTESDGLTIVSKYAACSGEDPRSFRIWVDDSTNKVVFEIVKYNNNEQRRKFSSFDAIPFNQWVHVLVSFNKGIGKIYINGKFSGEYNFGWSSFMSSQMPVHIGSVLSNCMDPGGIEGFYAEFNGSIDDVAIFDVNLSDCEIKILAKGPKACFDGCVGVCGQKANTYLASQTDWPNIGDYCEYGLPSATPSFPNKGTTVNWNCEINSSVVPCSASRNNDFMCSGSLPANSSYITNDNVDLVTDASILLVDINTSRKCEVTCDPNYYRVSQTCVFGTEFSGICGDRNTSFDYSEIDWPVDSEYCSVGIPSTSPAFPAQNSTVAWKCLGSQTDGSGDVKCSASRTFNTGVCDDTKPVGPGIITGYGNYVDPLYSTTKWTYNQGATGDMNCEWKCDVAAGYTRLGNTCVTDDALTSDVNNIEFIKLSAEDKNVIAEIQCSKNIKNTTFAIINEEGNDISPSVDFILPGGLVVANGNLDCNITPIKYILKARALGLDTYVGGQQYLVTASIPTPCNICLRSGYIFYDKETPVTIPDTNLIVIVLTACFAVYIVSRKRI